MNTHAVLENRLIDRSEPACRPRRDQLILTLTAIGLTAALVAFVSLNQTRSAYANAVVPPSDIAESPLYYVMHATQILLLFSAGLLALFSTDWHAIRKGYPLKFVLLIIAALVMAARGYSFSDLFSTKLVDWTGPFPFFLSVLIFIGVRRKHWRVLGAAMVILAAVFSTMAALGVFRLETFSRTEALAMEGGPLNALYWPATWIALREYSPDSFASRFRLVPMGIYSCLSFLTQTRLNFIMLVAFLVMYSFVQRRRRMPQWTGWTVGLIVVLWLGLFTAIFLTNTSGFERLESVADAFSSRLDDDSRSGQLIWFTESVPPRELLMGRGSFATWFWRVRDYHGGTDVAYLTLLLFGGLPLLLTYIATHLTPCFTVLRQKPGTWQLAAAAVVFLWGIRMFSSAYPAANIEYYPVLFCVGACISTEPLQENGGPLG